MSLLSAVRGLLVRTYRVRGVPDELSPFVIGDRGLARLYRSDPRVREVEDSFGCGAKTLVRDTPAGVAACIYFPDEMIRRLEHYPPQRGLNPWNFDAFATFVEEIDHLVVLAARESAHRPVSLFELELHANVSKYLVVGRFLAGGRPVDPGQRVELMRRLFDEEHFDRSDAEAFARYRGAARWAVRLLNALTQRSPRERLECLRAFHRGGLVEKLQLVRELGRP